MLNGFVGGAIDELFQDFDQNDVLHQESFSESDVESLNEEQSEKEQPQQNASNLTEDHDCR